MMKKIAYPVEIRQIAKDRFGCELRRYARFGADLRAGFNTTTTRKVSADAFNVPSNPAPASTPAPAPAPAPATTATTAPKPIPKIETPVYTLPVRTVEQSRVVPRTVFAPGFNVSPTTALAIADKLLNDPSVKNGPDVVKSTFEFAAIPHTPVDPRTRHTVTSADITPNAEVMAAIERGAATLEAAKEIREAIQARKDVMLIPSETPAQAAAVSQGMQDAAYTFSDADLAAFAAATQHMIETSRHKGIWERFLDWLKSVTT